MSHLEILMVQFYTSIPNWRFESPTQLTPIMFPSLKVLAFRGGRTYLEGILAQINIPLLSTLDLEFFNQLMFNLSRLLQFVHTTGTFRFRSTELHFDKEFVSVCGPASQTHRHVSVPCASKVQTSWLTGLLHFADL